MGLAKLKQRIHRKFNAANPPNISPVKDTGNTTTNLQSEGTSQYQFQPARAGAPTPQWQSNDASQPTYRPADHPISTVDSHVNGTLPVVSDAAIGTTPADTKEARTIKPLTERELAFEKTLEIPQAEIDKCNDADERRKVMRQYLRMQKRGRMYRPW